MNFFEKVIFFCRHKENFNLEFPIEMSFLQIFNNNVESKQIICLIRNLNTKKKTLKRDIFDNRDVGEDMTFWNDF